MVAESVAPQRTPRKAEGKALSRARKLNHREKRFCALIAQGFAARKAYITISGAKESTADVQAWRWQARPAIAAEIARLRGELTEEGAASRAEKRHLLARVMRSDEVETREKLTAVAIDNRMTGDDEPFRKAAGEDLRVSFFVVRIEDPSGGQVPAPGLLADPVANALNVTPARESDAAT